MTHPSPSPIAPVREVADPTGALVVYADAHHRGLEVDVCLVGGSGATHSPVRERRLRDRTVYCAVYPGLAAGQYQVLRPDRTVATTVTIGRGTLTEVPSGLL